MDAKQPWTREPQIRDSEWPRKGAKNAKRERQLKLPRQQTSAQTTTRTAQDLSRFANLFFALFVLFSAYSHPFLGKSSAIRPLAHSPFRTIGPAGFEPT